MPEEDFSNKAIGDTVALSITPSYLKKIGVMKQNPDPASDIGPLLETALQKVAFLPFAYKVDKWRWQVYAGKVKPADDDKAWWALTEQYQNVSRPVPLIDNDGFDAGAKFHVASDTPYARYFLPTCCNFSFTARYARRHATPAPCTGAQSMATNPPAPSFKKCLQWTPASRGSRR
jgi:peptidyl-dipeptidase A